MADMTMKEFYEHEVEWTKGQIEWYTKEIAYETECLESSRKDDRELVEHIWAKGPIQAVDVMCFGRNGKGKDGRGYKSRETREYLAKRKKWYRRRKHYVQELARYEALLAKEEMV